MDAPTELCLTNEPDANAFIAKDSLGLLVGLVLHQQIPTEKAFHSPMVLRDRLGRDLDPAQIANMDPEALEAVFKEKPALHRFPGSMAKRVQSVCEHVVETYDGSVAGIWEGVTTADQLMERLLAMPGFGEYKARIYIGVLAKRFGIKPKGFTKYLPTWPSIVDIASLDDLADLKARKKAWKESKADS
ncbi:MAG: HhH-GPD-type base excision DNA repair protein [Acidimicrobiia bacterium]|nr:HhH-GPD-type base excision DNA repair protein [Acidimicrobiia bacterium]MDX2467658.1 HhH-GPD-type base excision DNA repair protein [Acidimicrobiia bacterium]